MRKKAEGITQTKRLCTFSFSFLFSSPHLSLSLFLFFQSRRRRWREDPRCRNPCVTDFLPVVQQSVCPAPRPLVACHPLVAFYKGSAVFDEFVFLIVPEEEKKKERGGKKKGGRNRCNGWSDGWTEKRRQFFDPSSVHAHEGIQMQEVTHPVRSIYRSKDRALPFIRSILDTRELWSWIYFVCIFIFISLNTSSIFIFLHSPWCT